MKERISELFGEKELWVYPFAPDDATDRQLSGLARVEAFQSLDGWRVRLNCSSRSGLSREDTDALISAINRCWQWIGEQK